MTSSTPESSSGSSSGSTQGSAADSTTTGVDIVLENIVKKYPGQKSPAVTDLSLTIPAGEMVMFVGPSGCGKTTSLKMINRLIEPTSGTITIGGKDITRSNPTELRRQIGYVIQGGGLLPHMTVKQNIGIVPGLLGWDKKKIAARTDELLDLVGLDPDVYRDRYPRELSGGQQQRVGVARGLAADPPVILMDEPFGAVDPITRTRLQDELMSIQSELRKTIVIVTHDIDEAVKLGDRILVLDVGAEIAQYDTPDAILSAPANDYVADFVGAGSKLKQLTLLRVDDAELEQPETCHVGDDVAEVIARVSAAGKDSVLILDARERPREFLWLRTLRKWSKVPDFDPENSPIVDHRATLNDAMDQMLESSHAAVIVTNRGRFTGLVTFDAVTELLRSSTQAAHEAAGSSAAADGTVIGTPTASTGEVTGDE